MFTEGPNRFEVRLASCGVSATVEHMGALSSVLSSMGVKFGVDRGRVMKRLYVDNVHW